MTNRIQATKQTDSALNVKPKRSLGGKLFFVGGIVFSVAVLVCVIAAIALLALLPNPTEFSNALRTKTKVGTGFNVASVSSQTQKTETVSSTTESLAERLEHASAQDQSLESSGFIKKMSTPEIQAKYVELFDKLFEEDPSDVRVCDNLGRVPMTREQMEQPQSLLELLSEREGNAVVEAFRFPVVGILSDPDLKAFYVEAKEYDLKTQGLSESEKNSWLRKAGFYTDLATMIKGFMSRKDKHESYMAQGHTLMMLAQLSAMRPKLAADTKVQDLCREVESKVKSGEFSESLDFYDRVDALMKREGLKTENFADIRLTEVEDYKKAKAAASAK